MEERQINQQVFFLRSTNNKTFGVRSFLPSGIQPKAVVQIIPGMAEHAGRYHEFATFLAENGYGVFCADHPGSGLTAIQTESIGIMPATRGWEIMLDNIRSLYTYIRKEVADAPFYLFGHSMGSILARHFIAVYPVYIQGMVLSGSFETADATLKLSGLLTSLMIRIEGSKVRSKWFNNLFYKNLNMKYRKGPTKFEWISSVREEVDDYVADPLCGFDYSWGFYKTFFRGMLAMKRAQRNLKFRKTIPLLTICGQDDPVGNFGKDAMKIHRHYFRQRFQNNTVKVFRGRHELLHEENREQVYYFLLNWFGENLRP